MTLLPQLQLISSELKAHCAVAPFAHDAVGRPIAKVAGASFVVSTRVSQSPLSLEVQHFIPPPDGTHVPNNPAQQMLLPHPLKNGSGAKV